MDAPHAQIVIQVHIFNEGQTINLLWSVDTRPVGYISAMHRGLCMRKALVVTVASHKWAALKKEPFVNRAAEDLMCGKYWKVLYLLLRSVFPVFKLLRITDSTIPGMDNLWYLISQIISAVKKRKHSMW